MLGARRSPELSMLYELAQRRSWPVLDLYNLQPELDRLSSREIGRWAAPLLADCLHRRDQVQTRHRLDLVGFVLCRREAQR
jgi:hypothetical protein